MNEVITYTDYQSYKKELDAELQKTAEGFVRIGYLLKVAQDTDILKESGYANVVEFAKAEYNIDKTQVSRFIHINDRFSEDGYSNRLKAEYQGYGYAKLSIMLQLPDEINEELSPDFSKTEIQAIKDEIDAEKKISDIEVMLEKKDEVQQSLDSLLQQVLFQMGKEEAKTFETLWKAIYEEAVQGEEAVNRLAPAGQAVYSVRIPGTGRVMLTVNEDSDSVNITNVRTNEKESHSKKEVVEAFESICNGAGENMKECYQKMYGISFPEEKKVEVAPVQQEKTKAKSEPRKESKVKKAKVETPNELEEQQEQEEQLPGQTSIEADFPEYMPDDTPEAVETSMEEIEEESENVNFTECETNSIRGYKAGITNALRRLEDAAGVEDWEEVKKLADDISWRAEQIMKEQTGEEKTA